MLQRKGHGNKEIRLVDRVVLKLLRMKDRKGNYLRALKWAFRLLLKESSDEEILILTGILPQELGPWNSKEFCVLDSRKQGI